MSSKLDPKTASEPVVYQIRIEGHLGRPLANWFEGLTIVLTENGHTLVTGPVVDQTALFGLLRKVRDLGMPLVSVHRVEPAPSTPLGTGPSTPLGTGPSTPLGTGPSTPLGTGPSTPLGTGQVDASDVKDQDGDI